MEKTAVEWLEDEVYKIINEYEPFACSYYLEKAFEKAKAMEKQQIENAFDEGQEYEYQYHINSAPKFDSETYYNETFGK